MHHCSGATEGTGLYLEQSTGTASFLLRRVPVPLAQQIVWAEKAGNEEIQKWVTCFSNSVFLALGLEV